VSKHPQLAAQMMRSDAGVHNRSDTAAGWRAVFLLGRGTTSGAARSRHADGDRSQFIRILHRTPLRPW